MLRNVIVSFHGVVVLTRRNTFGWIVLLIDSVKITVVVVRISSICAGLSLAIRVEFTGGKDNEEK